MVSCRDDLNESASKTILQLHNIHVVALSIHHVLLLGDECRCCARVVVRECSLRFFESTSLSRIVLGSSTIYFSPLGRFPHSLTHSRDNTQHTHSTDRKSNSIECKQSRIVAYISESLLLTDRRRCRSHRIAVAARHSLFLSSCPCSCCPLHKRLCINTHTLTTHTPHSASRVQHHVVV